jgi:homocysteine S-methyltransferase
MQAITLLDGGLGQEIYRRSNRPAHPLWSVMVMMDNPGLVQAVHEDFIRAGARVITLNTYAATPTRLARDGEIGWLEPLQRRAFEVADAARNASGQPHGPVQLAGCLPPLVASYSPETTLPHEDCLREYRAIVDLQPDVDLFLCETLATIAEGRAAAEAACESGKPVLLSFTLADDGSNTLRSGETIEDMLNAVKEFNLAGLLFNCSLPEVITRALPKLQGLSIPYGAYANGFTAVQALKPGGTVDALTAREDLGPAAYSAFAREWLDLGARILGGCCEVGPAHIARLHDDLRHEGYTVTGLPGCSQSSE